MEIFFCGNCIFPSEGKLGIKLKATIIKNSLGLFFPALSSESILPASQHNLAHHKIFKLTPGVQTDSYVALCTPMHTEKGTLRRPHTHCTSFLKGFPPLWQLQLSHHLTTFLCLLLNPADKPCAQQSAGEQPEYCFRQYFKIFGHGF